MLPDSPPRLEQALAHEHFLRAVARGVLGGDADVDDVLQETFLVAWREAPQRPGSLRAWLGTIARRLALDHRRSAVRRSLREGVASRTESLPSIDTIAAREETRRRLVTAVLALEEPYRTTMLWRYYEARSIPEIAELQSVPVATVRTRLQRALGQLRTRLDAEHGGNRRAWSMLLSPLVPPIGGVAAATAIGGGLLVKKVVAVAALLLLTLGGYAVVTRDRPPEESGSPQPPAMAQVEPATPVRSVLPPTPDLAAPGRSRRAPSSPSERAQPPFRLQVVALDGTPVAGATVDTLSYALEQLGEVRMAADQLARTVTDAQGRCDVGDPPSSIPGLVAKTVLLRVIADGFALQMAIAVRDVDSRVVLDRGGSLAIRAVDDAGQPVSGATVTICEGTGSIPFEGWGRPKILHEMRADGAGRVELGLPPGGYRARVHAPDLRPVDSDAIEIVAGKTTEWHARLGPGIVANIRVVDEQSRPVGEAKVRTLGPLSSRATTTTERDGRCRITGIGLPIEGLPPHEQAANRLYFAVQATGFADVTGSRDLPPASATIDLDVRIERGVALRIRVVDSEARLIPGARARWSETPNDTSPVGMTQSEVAPSEDGWIDMPRVAPGKRQLSIETTYYGRYARKLADLDVRPSDVERTVILERVDGVVSGRVLRDDGSSATGGIVSLDFETDSRPWRDASLGATIGVDGRFCLKGLPTGKAVLLVWVKPFPKQRFPIDVGTESPGEEHVLRIHSGRSVAGRVVDRDGVAIAGVAVRLTREVEVGVPSARSTGTVIESETQTSTDGSFELFAEENGELSVRVNSGKWFPMQGNPRTAKAGARDVLLRVKPASEGMGIPLHVRATSAGKPYLGKLDVTWVGPSGMQMAADMGSDVKLGHRYVVFETGPFDLTLCAPAHGPTVVRGVRFVETALGTMLDVELDRGLAIRVRVRDGAGGGRPLANTRVVVNGTTVETDEVGECESTGWPLVDGPVDLTVALAADPEFTAARTPKATVPGSTEVTLRRRGFVTVRLGVEFQSLTEDVVIGLVDGKGATVDQARIEAARARGVSSEAKKELSVFADGTYRVTADMGSKHAEATIEARVGQRIEVPLTLR